MHYGVVDDDDDNNNMEKRKGFAKRYFSIRLYYCVLYDEKCVAA